jgi:hypothetical protein
VFHFFEEELRRLVQENDWIVEDVTPDDEQIAP